MSSRHGEEGKLPTLIPYRREEDGTGTESMCVEFLDVDVLQDTAPGSRLRALRTMQKLGVGQLSSRSGIPPEVIKQAENRPWDVPIIVLIELCKALKVDLSQLSENLVVRVNGDGDIYES